VNLQVEKLAVSLPTHDLSGSHSLTEYHRRLIFENAPSGSDIHEIEFPNELVFLIKAKPEDQHARK
jgi:hypothetical protein